MAKTKNIAIISSSGGLDSTTLIYKVLNETDWDIVLVSFDYGQVNEVELMAQKNIYEFLKKSNFSKRILLRTELSIPVFKEVGLVNMQSITDADHDYYTPSRNLLFSTTVASFGEAIATKYGYDVVLLGMGLHKHTEEAYGGKGRGEVSQYWDITPEFAKRLQNVFDLNDQKRIEIYAPYVNSYKKNIIEDVVKYKVPYKETWTCYEPQKVEDNGRDIYSPCLKCEACMEREINAKGIIEDINDYQIIK
jgi:7-cyano-7-deazaguanine synthase